MKGSKSVPFSSRFRIEIGRNGDGIGAKRGQNRGLSGRQNVRDRKQWQSCESAGEKGPFVEWRACNFRGKLFEVKHPFLFLATLIGFVFDLLLLVTTPLLL